MSSNVTVSSLEEELQCPVCFSLPRDLPIPCCPKGHCICRHCKSSLEQPAMCPSCRTPMGDNVSSLAGALLSKIPHQCRFADHGCEMRMELDDIKKHEKACFFSELTGDVVKTKTKKSRKNSFGDQLRRLQQGRNSRRRTTRDTDIGMNSEYLPNSRRRTTRDADIGMNSEYHSYVPTSPLIPPPPPPIRQFGFIGARNAAPARPSVPTLESPLLNNFQALQEELRMSMEASLARRSRSYPSITDEVVVRTELTDGGANARRNSSREPLDAAMGMGARLMAPGHGSTASRRHSERDPCVEELLSMGLRMMDVDSRNGIGAGIKGLAGLIEAHAR